MMINGIDEKDNQIIKLLLENARLSYSEIGEQVDLSRTAVKNRITALEKAGVIEGYKVILRPQPPEMATFIVNIETKPECFEKTKTVFVESPQVLTLLQTTGNCHLVAICLGESIQAMRDFLKGMYKVVPEIISINAHLVIDVIKGSVAPQNYDFEVYVNEQRRNAESADSV